MDPVIQEFISQLVGDLGGGGSATLVLASVAGTLLTFGVRLLQLDSIQAALPESMRWNRLAPFYKFLIPFVLALLGGLVSGVLAGMTGKALIVAGLSAAVATFMHQGTKALGETEATSKLKKDPGYQPSPFRKSVSLIVPIDVERAKKNLEP